MDALNLVDEMKDYMEISVVLSCGFRKKSDTKTNSSSDHHLRLQNLGIGCYNWKFLF